MFVSTVSHAGEDVVIKHSTIELKSVTGEETWEGLWNKYLSKSTIKKQNKYQQTDKIIRITAHDENAFIFFTKKSNPAHPSFAKIYLSRVNGQLKLSTFSYTWGDEASYQKWVKEDILEYSRALARKINTARESKQE